jgi:hypothetical protein
MEGVRPATLAFQYSVLATAKILSLMEREAEIQEIFRTNDLRDLRGHEFLRLLRLAHTEGLLVELLQDSGVSDHRVCFLPSPHGAAGEVSQQAGLESLSKIELAPHQDCLQIGDGLNRLKSWFLRTSRCISSVILSRLSIPPA